MHLFGAGPSEYNGADAGRGARCSRHGGQRCCGARHAYPEVAKHHKDATGDALADQLVRVAQVRFQVLEEANGRFGAAPRQLLQCGEQDLKVAVLHVGSCIGLQGQLEEKIHQTVQPPRVAIVHAEPEPASPVAKGLVCDPPHARAQLRQQPVPHLLRVLVSPVFETAHHAAENLRRQPLAAARLVVKACLPLRAEQLEARQAKIARVSFEHLGADVVERISVGLVDLLDEKEHNPPQCVPRLQVLKDGMAPLVFVGGCGPLLGRQREVHLHAGRPAVPAAEVFVREQEAVVPAPRATHAHTTNHGESAAGGVLSAAGAGRG